MTRILMSLLSFSLVLGLSLADEPKKDAQKPAEKKPEKKPEPKAPDWSQYADHSEVTGEISKADEESISLRRPGGRYPQQQQESDPAYKYAEGGLARREKEPPFTDDKGKKRSPTVEERAALKKPAGVPGFAMERTDLKAGDIVKLKLVRPKSIPMAKVKPEDLVIKYAFFLAEGRKPADMPKDKEKEKKPEKKP